MWTFMITVKLRAVDQSTIQFWNILIKKCATNQDRLLFATLRYKKVVFQKMHPRDVIWVPKLSHWVVKWDWVWCSVHILRCPWLRLSWYQFMLVGDHFKVRIFWEGHKIWKNLSLKICHYSVTSNFKWNNFSNFVTFSECPNFTIKFYFLPKSSSAQSI